MTAWQYLPTNREDLLRLDKEKIDDFLTDWSDTFWDFANNIRSAVEEANEIIRSQENNLS